MGEAVTWKELQAGDVIFARNSRSTPVFVLVGFLGTRIIKWLDLVNDEVIESSNMAEEIEPSWSIIRNGVELQ